MHICDCGIDLRFDGNAGDGGDIAEGGEADRHRLAFSNRSLNRDRTDLGGAGRRAVRGPEPAGKHNNANQGDHRPAKEPFSLDHQQFSVRIIWACPDAP
jgi:hypothetical protein